MKEFNFLINGKWVRSSKKLEVKNPYNNEIIAVTFRPTKEQILESIEAAKKAFKRTRELKSFERAELLKKVSQALQKRKEEIANIMCLESGKPISLCKGEVDRACHTFSIASEEATRIEGEVMPLDLAEKSGDRIGITKRFPIGPILGISPFNFPLNLVCHKVAPALASGNSIILKPSSETPITCILLGEIIEKAGAIPGMVNVLPASSSDMKYFIESDDIKMITFTGSGRIGWELKSKSRKKKVCLELGGDAASIVEPDADISHAIKKNVIGAFAYSGQVCISVQRIFVHEDIFTEFLDKFVSETEKLKVGNPKDDDTFIGPMITEKEAKRIESWVNDAGKEGAKILCEGKRQGAFYMPTVLTNVNSNSTLTKEEAFAPVVIIEKYSDFNDAINMVNSSKFGLQAGVFTNNIKKIMQAYNTIDVGGVIINDFPTFRVDSMPYGGIKESGFGREGVKYTMEEMTELKLLVLDK